MNDFKSGMESSSIEHASSNTDIDSSALNTSDITDSDISRESTEDAVSADTSTPDGMNDFGQVKKSDASSQNEMKDNHSGLSETDGSQPIEQDYLESHIGDILEQKQYEHWNSPEESELNRSSIEDYSSKKRSVDKAALMTQRDTLITYGDYFDQDALARIDSEIGSNKTELYNEPLFIAEKAPNSGAYTVVGLRDLRDGKICIRDCDNVDTLVHTSSHEIMHDLSYQDKKNDITHSQMDGHLSTVSRATEYSGIFRAETTRTLFDNGYESIERTERNRYLNEGITELYTIEAMQFRGEYPRFDSYTQEMAWAMQLREKVGSDVMAKAYYGGDTIGLAEKVNSMSPVENAWDEINIAINEYHNSVSVYNRRGDLSIKQRVDSMIEELEPPKTMGSKRLR